ncbi:MAG: glycosyltransferase family 4 protein [Acidobacteria bacterium]|nr:glycosyltransferase family 4 protein [Acidobacteriota bacterium]
MKELRHHLAVDLYYNEQAPVEELQREFETYPIAEFPRQRDRYDEVVYHLGNHSGFHRTIYQLAWRFPATIVLHDYNLSAFMHDAFYRQPDGDLYQQALTGPNGEPARTGLHALLPKLGRNIGAIPMCHAVVNRSRKVIVHHRWVMHQFPKADHVRVIPHFARITHRPSSEEITNFKKRFSIKENQFVLSCLGFTNRNKLPSLQVEVVKRLLDHGYPVHLVFAGETAPDVKRLETEVQTGENRENITFTGYLDETDYYCALFASDVLINLRNPSMGEASGTLMQALAAAKPTIISDVNQYKEFPDQVCWKVTHDEHEADLLYEYLVALLTNKRLRAAISAASLDYAQEVFSFSRIVPQWIDALTSARSDATISLINSLKV